MAAFDTTTIIPGASVTARLTRSVFAARDALSAQKLRRNTRKALSRLTDRELDDIGLARGDILRRF